MPFQSKPILISRADNVWYGMTQTSKLMAISGITFTTLMVLNNFFGIRHRRYRVIHRKHVVKYEDLI